MRSTCGCQHAMMAPSSLNTILSSLYPATSPFKLVFGTLAFTSISSSFGLNFLGALKTLTETLADVEKDRDTETPLANASMTSGNMAGFEIAQKNMVFGTTVHKSYMD